MALQKILDTPNLEVKVSVYSSELRLQRANILQRQELAVVARTVDNLIRTANKIHHKSRNTQWLAKHFGHDSGDSKNIDTLLTSSTLFRLAGHPKLHYPAKTAADRRLSAKLHVMWGIPINFRESPDSYGDDDSDDMFMTHCCGRARVYDLRTYTEETMWGPFLDDGSGFVDWEKVEAIFVVLGFNLEQLSDRTQRSGGIQFPRMWNRPFHGVTPGSYETPTEEPLTGMVPRPLSSVINEDPYNVTGTWMRVRLSSSTQSGSLANFRSQVVCFLDYSDFSDFNFAHSNIDDLPDPREPLETDEATRMIAMSLTAVKITPPEPEDGQALPVVHFEGMSESMHQVFDLNANSRIRGTVRMTKEGEVRWTSFSVFHGEERWRSEGVQIGGARSRRGVVGTWFDKDYSSEGPAGPTAFWKISNMLKSAREF